MNKIEKYFESIDIKQKSMIVGIFVLSVFFVVKTFVPPLLEKQESLQNSISDIERKISKKICK